MTVDEISAQLQNLGRQLEAASNRVVDADATKALTRNVYKCGFAKTYLAAEGSIQAREQTATLACEELRITADLAATELLAATLAKEDLKERIGIGRSLLSTARAEMGVDRSVGSVAP